MHTLEVNLNVICLRDFAATQHVQRANDRVRAGPSQPRAAALDRASCIQSDDVERVLANIDTDDRC